MRNKLTKFAEQWKDDCLNRFEIKRDKLNAAQEDYKEALEDNSDLTPAQVQIVFDKLDDAVDEWNGEVRDALDWRDHCVESMMDYYDSRSEG